MLQNIFFILFCLSYFSNCDHSTLIKYRGSPTCTVSTSTTLLVNWYKLSWLYVLLNWYKFCIVRFFPGPKNSTLRGPPFQVTTIFVNTQIFSYIFKLGFRNIQEKLENVPKSGKQFSKYEHNSLDLQLHITWVESNVYIVSSNTLTYFKQLK